MCICYVLSQTVHMDRRVYIGRGITSLSPLKSILSHLKFRSASE